MTMKSTLKMFAVPTLTLVVGLVAGAALGQRQGFGMGMRFLEQEISGSLSMHVEAASSIRVGDPDRALALLDTMIDGALLSVHAQSTQPAVERTVAQAKSYRSVVPRRGPLTSTTSSLEKLLARSGR